MSTAVNVAATAPLSTLILEVNMRREGACKIKLDLIHGLVILATNKILISMDE